MFFFFVWQFFCGARNFLSTPILLYSRSVLSLAWDALTCGFSYVLLISMMLEVSHNGIRFMEKQTTVYQKTDLARIHGPSNEICSSSEQTFSTGIAGQLQDLEHEISSWDLSRKWLIRFRVKAVSSQCTLRPLVQWRAQGSWKHCLIVELWTKHYKHLGQMTTLMN